MITRDELEAMIRRLERDKEINGGLSIKEEKYLAVMKRCQDLEAVAIKLVLENTKLWGRLNEVCQK